MTEAFKINLEFDRASGHRIKLFVMH